MKTIYFDCFSGAAGDMILGALIDAGLPLDELKTALGSLGVEGWDVSAEKVVKTGITATKFRVHEHAAIAAGSTAPGGGHRHYHLAGIRRRIEQSSLSNAGKRRAKALFDRLARGRGGHPQHAGGEGAPARSRRAGLHRRYRRIGVCARVVWRGPNCCVTNQCRQRNCTHRARHGIPCRRLRRCDSWATLRSMPARWRPSC